MTDLMHFKFAHDGSWHRFVLPTRGGRKAFRRLKKRILAVLGATDQQIWWDDGETINCLNDSVDLAAAIAFAEQEGRNLSTIPCVYIQFDPTPAAQTEEMAPDIKQDYTDALVSTLKQVADDPIRKRVEQVATMSEQMLKSTFAIQQAIEIANVEELTGLRIVSEKISQFDAWFAEQERALADINRNTEEVRRQLNQRCSEEQKQSKAAPLPDDLSPEERRLAHLGFLPCTRTSSARTKTASHAACTVDCGTSPSQSGHATAPQTPSHAVADREPTAPSSGPYFAPEDNLAQEALAQWLDMCQMNLAEALRNIPPGIPPPTAPFANVARRCRSARLPETVAFGDHGVTTAPKMHSLDDFLSLGEITGAANDLEHYFSSDPAAAPDADDITCSEEEVPRELQSLFAALDEAEAIADEEDESDSEEDSDSEDVMDDAMSTAPIAEDVTHIGAAPEAIFHDASGASSAAFTINQSKEFRSLLDSLAKSEPIAKGVPHVCAADPKGVSAPHARSAELLELLASLDKAEAIADDDEDSEDILDEPLAYDANQLSAAALEEMLDQPISRFRSKDLLALLESMDKEESNDPSDVEARIDAALAVPTDHGRAVDLQTYVESLVDKVSSEAITDECPSAFTLYRSKKHQSMLASMAKAEEVIAVPTSPPGISTLPSSAYIDSVVSQVAAARAAVEAVATIDMEEKGRLPTISESSKDPSTTWSLPRTLNTDAYGLLFVGGASEQSIAAAKKKLVTATPLGQSAPGVVVAPMEVKSKNQRRREEKKAQYDAEIRAMGGAVEGEEESVSTPVEAPQPAEQSRSQFGAMSTEQLMACLSMGMERTQSTRTVAPSAPWTVGYNNPAAEQQNRIANQINTDIPLTASTSAEEFLADMLLRLSAPSVSAADCFKILDVRMAERLNTDHQSRLERNRKLVEKNEKMAIDEAMARLTVGKDEAKEVPAADEQVTSAPSGAPAADDVVEQPSTAAVEETAVRSSRREISHRRDHTFTAPEGKWERSSCVRKMVLWPMPETVPVTEEVVASAPSDAAVDELEQPTTAAVEETAVRSSLAGVTARKELFDEAPRSEDMMPGGCWRRRTPAEERFRMELLKRMEESKERPRLNLLPRTKPLLDLEEPRERPRLNLAPRTRRDQDDAPRRDEFGSRNVSRLNQLPRTNQENIRKDNRESVLTQEVRDEVAESNNEQRRAAVAMMAIELSQEATSPEVFVMLLSDVLKSRPRAKLMPFIEAILPSISSALLSDDIVSIDVLGDRLAERFIELQASTDAVIDEATLNASEWIDNLLHELQRPSPRPEALKISKADIKAMEKFKAELKLRYPPPRSKTAETSAENVPPASKTTQPNSNIEKFKAELKLQRFSKTAKTAVPITDHTYFRHPPPPQFGVPSVVRGEYAQTSASHIPGSFEDRKAELERKKALLAQMRAAKKEAELGIMAKRPDSHATKKEEELKTNKSSPDHDDEDEVAISRYEEAFECREAEKRRMRVKARAAAQRLDEKQEQKEKTSEDKMLRCLEKQKMWEKRELAIKRMEERIEKKRTAPEADEKSTNLTSEDEVLRCLEKQKMRERVRLAALRLDEKIEQKRATRDDEVDEDAFLSSFAEEHARQKTREQRELAIKKIPTSAEATMYEREREQEQEQLTRFLDDLTDAPTVEEETLRKQEEKENVKMVEEYMEREAMASLREQCRRLAMQNEESKKTLDAIERKIKLNDARIGELLEKEKRMNQLNAIRTLLNKMTPETADALTKEFIEHKVHEWTHLNDVVSIIFDKAVVKPQYCGLFATLCFKQEQEELRTNNNISLFVNALRVRAQDTFSPKETDRRKKHGNIIFIGHLFMRKLIKIRIILFCVVDLLQSVTEEKEEIDEASVECAVHLLELTGARLQEDADVAEYVERAPSRQPRAPSFPMAMAIQTLEQAAPLVSSKLRSMIENLIELRKNGWMPKNSVASLETVSDEAVKENVEMPAKKEKVQATPVTPSSTTNVADWKCKNCCFRNRAAQLKCFCCRVAKQVAKKPDSSLTIIDADTLKSSTNWTCLFCYVSNKKADAKCECCGEAKPVKKRKKPVSAEESIQVGEPKSKFPTSSAAKDITRRMGQCVINYGTNAIELDEARDEIFKIIKFDCEHFLLPTTQIGFKRFMAAAVQKSSGGRQVAPAFGQVLAACLQAAERGIREEILKGITEFCREVVAKEAWKDTPKIWDIVAEVLVVAHLTYGAAVPPRPSIVDLQDVFQVAANDTHSACTLFVLFLEKLAGKEHKRDNFAETLNDIISLIFAESVERPELNRFLASMCTAQINKERVKEVDAFRSAILVRAQATLTTSAHDEAMKGAMSRNLSQSDYAEAVVEFKRIKFANIMFIGQLYLHGIVSSRIVMQCIFEMQGAPLKSIFSEVDSDSVECAVHFITLCGEKLDQEAALPPATENAERVVSGQSLDSIFATLNAAALVVKDSVKLQIVQLAMLRALGWKTEQKQAADTPKDTKDIDKSSPSNPHPLIRRLEEQEKADYCLKLEEVRMKEKLISLLIETTYHNKEEKTLLFLSYKVHECRALDKIVSLIFDRAIEKPNTLRIIAGICAAQIAAEIRDSGDSKFLQAVYDRICDVLEKDTNTEHVLQLEAAILKETNVDKKVLTQVELDQAKTDAKKAKHANIK